jgi:hypothetical protein
MGFFEALYKKSENDKLLAAAKIDIELGDVDRLTQLVKKHSERLTIYDIQQILSYCIKNGEDTFVPLVCLCFHPKLFVKLPLLLHILCEDDGIDIFEIIISACAYQIKDVGVDYTELYFSTLTADELRVLYRFGVDLTAIDLMSRIMIVINSKEQEKVSFIRETWTLDAETARNAMYLAVNRGNGAMARQLQKDWKSSDEESIQLYWFATISVNPRITEHIDEDLNLVEKDDFIKEWVESDIAPEMIPDISGILNYIRQFIGFINKITKKNISIAE